MKRIILFRFHKNLAVCKNKLELLKEFNPGVSIFGLYGGEEPEYEKFRRNLSQYFENIYCIKNKSEEWKWKNSDLAINSWYKKIGKAVSFDMLHIVEWDLLLLDSLDNIYNDIPKGGVGLTALVPLKIVEDKWMWTAKEPYKSDWKNLLSFAREKFDYNQKLYASLGPGAVLPRRFIGKYSSIKFPEICHDELRLPLFGQILGYKLYNTGFYKDWFDSKEERFFNCEGRNIELSAVKSELNKPAGRRVFHPYRKVFEI